jgi:hypothetical protein
MTRVNGRQLDVFVFINNVMIPNLVFVVILAVVLLRVNQLCILVL